MRILTERLLVMGDAVCAFNPVYGQGMTAAALGAQALLEAFHSGGGEWIHQSFGFGLPGLRIFPQSRN
jgi:2-polyprenyl-6-methoxyphenol hydroxylase-like FAD-dependent oxidoreductase